MNEKALKCISATNRNFPGGWATRSRRSSSRRLTRGGERVDRKKLQTRGSF
jgi:hypothetical protein